MENTLETKSRSKVAIIAIIIFFLLVGGASFAIVTAKKTIETPDKVASTPNSSNSTSSSTTVSTSPTSTSANASNTSGPLLTEQELRDYVSKKNLETYWIGPRVGDKYLPTIDSDGSIRVKYVPINTVDFSGANFTTVATYKVQDAYSIVGTAATIKGNTGFMNADLNQVAYSLTKPTNVYTGLKNKAIEVEVFDPTLDQALVLSMTKGLLVQIK